MTSRQQQRQQERALRKRGEAAVSSGLPQTPEKADLVAVAYVLTRMLRETSAADRASRAAAAMHAMSEASTRKAPGKAKLACAKGCGYCCHTWVGATVPEVMLLARALRADAGRSPARIPGIIARSTALAGLSPLQRFGARLACPLLIDNACSQYRERPVVCRQATSLDLARCIEEYEGLGHGGEIPVSAVYLAHARNARVPLIAALRLAGLETHTYELSAALARALGASDGEARWLGGEDLMTGVARGPGEPAAALQAVDMIVREIGALNDGAG